MGKVYTGKYKIIINNNNNGRKHAKTITYYSGRTVDNYLFPLFPKVWVFNYCYDLITYFVKLLSILLRILHSPKYGVEPNKETAIEGD